MDQLSPEQIFGAKFLAERRVAGLFDRPGFGKSAQFVRAGDLIGANRVTVLCPPSATFNEAAEYEKWTRIGWPVAVLKTGADPVPAFGVVVCNYVLAATPNMAKKLRKRGCDVLILDESHHLKNGSGARTKAVFAAKGIASTAGKVWFITGSPTPNDVSEYFVFAKVCGAWSGTYNQFTERYCLMAESQFGPKVIGTNNERLPELLAMLAPYAIGRDAIEDGRSALSVDSAIVEGEAPDYSCVEPETLAAIEKAIAAGNWKALSGPAVATVRRITGVAKARGVATLVRDALEAGHEQALVFAEHTTVIDILADELSDYSRGIIDGRTRPNERETIIRAFEPGYSGQSIRVAICQRMSLKESRTMTGATRVIVGEPAWTPEDNTQMIARAWRRGQRRPVHASLASLPGSIDDAIVRANARKARDIAAARIVTPS